MSADIQVAPQTLRLAAREAQAAANTVSQAKQAAAAALPGNAFGVLCSPLFLPIYGVVLTGADALLESAAQSIVRAANGLLSLADNFEQADIDSKTTIESLS